MSDLRTRVQNCLLGVHLGDRAGIETEMMTREEILEVTGGAGIRHPSDRIDPKRRKIADTRDLPPGSTSDDSALCDANAEGFIMAGGYHHELFVLLHLCAFKESLSGWGGTTKIAMWQLDKHYRGQKPQFGELAPPEGLNDIDLARWRGVRPRAPHVPALTAGKGLGRGNGVAMKIAPFGLYSAIRWGHNSGNMEMLEQIVEHGRMTHSDLRASIAAYAVAQVIANVMHEPLGSDEWDKAKFADRLRLQVAVAEGRYRFMLPREDSFLERLNDALMLFIRDPAAFSTAWNRKKTSDALVTVPLAIGIFLHRPTDPCAAILEAVNAGGDTDTVAAMVGAMCGANSASPDTFPVDWRETLRDRGSRAIRLGSILYAVAAGECEPHGYDLDEIKRELGYL